MNWVIVGLGVFHGILFFTVRRIAGTRRMRVRYFLAIRRCIGGQCPNKGNHWHMFAERVAWTIMSGERPGWKVVPAVIVEAYLVSPLLVVDHFCYFLQCLLVKARIIDL